MKMKTMNIFCSTLVSNELGAGKPDAVRTALSAVVLLAVSEFLTASIIIFFCRGILGYAFSGEQEVVDGVKEMVPFLCLSIIMDNSQAVLSGVARGSGWQHIGAYVNLGSYYIVGIPVVLLLGFVFDLKGNGQDEGISSKLKEDTPSIFADVACLPILVVFFQSTYFLLWRNKHHFYLKRSRPCTSKKTEE